MRAEWARFRRQTLHTFSRLGDRLILVQRVVALGDAQLAVAREHA